ncbi:hypothetical protein J6590_092847 [Homalodisca vitripennis]|nr:hypothetical protein J6590_092847 [Homalodisca vitripennis]
MTHQSKMGVGGSSSLIQGLEAEMVDVNTRELRSSESPGIRADILSASSRSHIEAMQVNISPLVAINRTEPLMGHR